MNTMLTSKHKARILALTGEHFDELHAMWSRMFEPQACEDCLARLEDHVHTFYTDLRKETSDKEQGILSDTAGLRNEASGLMRLLHKAVDIGERPDDVPLDIWYSKLEKYIEQLREELNSRRAEIRELLQQQQQLCDELGERPLSLPADPLPLPEEMDTFREHLAQLRGLRVQRLRDMDELRQNINKNIKLLELQLRTDSEKQLLNADNQKLTPNSYVRLQEMDREFADQLQDLIDCIDEMRGKIESLWQRLRMTDEYAMRRVRESTSYNQCTYDILREELERCQALRQQNLIAFVEQLRIEINEWWDLSLKSTKERRRFTTYYCDTQTEDVLEQFEKELDNLKEFYNSNRKIFELYANRGELWARMEALEAKANDPNRFNNRGGQLLKEEKERKTIMSRLPKIDQQITELVQVYMSQTNTPFLVHGDDILERMSADWERHHQSKKQPSAQKKDVSNTSGQMKPPMVPLTPNAQKSNRGIHGSTSSLKKTPTKVNASTTAKSTGNLHKRRHPQHHNTNSPQPAAAAKRNLITSLECNNAGRKIGVNGQKLLKSPQRKVRVLEYSVRRGKGSGRPSTGSRNPQKMRPIPQIHVRPPSGEENESPDEEVGDLEAVVAI
ncbi:protein regulator of cytokinesis 1 [Drosophila mauritiana]|uniref:Protein regulator of cytokinesis 1 n=1 Tax=Drosophila mauritiana TaxID=7226 RepID=A0A6P8KMK3_DROMA|nr:protein regulator of cytokinesis 1 [Drosophila mauritiana]